MAEKPGTRAWRQPKDRQERRSSADIIARAAQQQEGWAGSLERQRDIITRLQSERAAYRQAAIELARTSDMSLEEAEKLVEQVVADFALVEPS